MESPFLTFFVCFGLAAVWRHVLGTKDAIDGVDIALGKCKESCLDVPTLMYHSSVLTPQNYFFSDVITLSSEGSMLRSWNLPDGQLVWETSLHSAQHSKSLLSVPVSYISLGVLLSEILVVSSYYFGFLFMN